MLNNDDKIIKLSPFILFFHFNTGLELNENINNHKDVLCIKRIESCINLMRFIVRVTPNRRFSYDNPKNFYNVINLT